MQRRSFFSTIAALAPLQAQTSPEPQVVAIGDGLALSPAEQARLLAKLTAGDGFETDSYSRGGVVRKLEERVAALLGKEDAVWMPTGTLANHLAVRMLAGEKRRVLVQAESHLYNDCGDCAQSLSNLTLLPLAPQKSTFSLDEAEAAVHRGAGGRVAVPVGALQIETPVRRRQGQGFDLAEMRKISTWARERGIGRHLDGARLFLEAAYTGVPLRDYAALFDTVYISMYKYFNAPGGAVLAGPKALLENAYHVRRMFGGGLAHVWPFAAIALHYLEGFSERFSKARETSEAAIALLARDGNFEIERIPGGTNIFRFRVRGVNALIYQQRLLLAGVTAAEPVNEWFTAQVNETWLRAPAAEIVDRFRKAMG